MTELDVDAHIKNYWQKIEEAGGFPNEAKTHLENPVERFSIVENYIVVYFHTILKRK